MPTLRRSEHEAHHHGSRSPRPSCWASPRAAAATTTAAATSSAGFQVPSRPIKSSIGAGEGELNLIVWAGYAEDGSTDPKVDWVTPFEKSTGCQVNAKTANTSDEMVTLMRTGRYDGVSASGNASVRLIAGGDVVPIDTKILTNYANIDPLLKNQSYNSVNGKMYGAPHGWGANLLTWNTKDVKTAPNSWGVVFDPSNPNKGKLTAYDDPIYIADAALYLSKTQPNLKITNPYELDAAAVRRGRVAAEEAAAAHRPVLVGLHEGSRPRSRRATRRVGTTWQVIANLLDGRQGADQDGAAQGGLDRLVGHLDAVLQGRSTPTAWPSG